MESNTSTNWQQIVDDSQTFPVSALSELTGLSLEVLKKEGLISSHLASDDHITLEVLREAALRYLEQTS